MEELLLKDFTRLTISFSDELRKEHLLRCKDLSLILSQRLSLTKESQNIIMAASLFHDLGKFYESQNHAQISIDILEDDKTLYKYFNQYEINIIYNAIRYHSDYLISNNVDSVSKFFLKMLKDIDKIDKFNRVKDMEFKDDIREELKESFCKDILIKRKDDFNESEYLIHIMSYIYDIHFNESLVLLNEVILEKFYKNNKVNSEEFLIYKKQIDDFIKRRLV